MTREEYMAAIAHEANRLFCIRLGDNTQVHWEDAPAWQRTSSVAGVCAAIDGATPEELHEGWATIKLADGWVYGEIKDAEAKTHPCLLPYDQLPEAQRIKDTLFRNIVVAFGKALWALESRGGE